MASPDRPCLKHDSLKTPYSKVYWEGTEFIYNFHFNILHGNCFWYEILMNVQSGLSLAHLISGMVLSQIFWISVPPTFSEAPESVPHTYSDHINSVPSGMAICMSAVCPASPEELLSFCMPTDTYFLWQCLWQKEKKKATHIGCLYCGGLSCVIFSYPDL